MSFIPAELINKKKHGQANTPEEIRWIINSFTSGALPDYQMSAWAMAVWYRGMTDNEIAVFTEAMRDSGRKFNFKFLNAPRVDKHSTGGVGDKTTLIIGPILAAAKVFIPMIAGRALGHTGGTLDKLESIPGFRTQLSQQEFEKLIEKNYFAMMSQTADICPADRKLYALRDVTSTVDSLPLICGSIMSKKLAEDLTGLVLDVKFGSGAFMKSIDDAVKLATILKTTGENNGVRVSALITNMNEPLGRFSGNSLEVKECLDILSNKKCLDRGIDFYETTRELSLELSAHLLFLAQKAPTVVAGRTLAEELLISGAALKAFMHFLEYQGPAQLENLPIAKFSKDVCAAKNGFVFSINTEHVGLAGIELGAGRKSLTDTLDYSAGIESLVRIGMPVVENQPLFRMFANSNSVFASAGDVLSKAIVIDKSKPTELLPLVVKVLT